MRQRCEAIGEGWIYDTLFASHSNYVHPTWHELRTFHLATEQGALVLDPTYGGMAPIAAFVVARVVAIACGAAARFLPTDLDPADTAERVDRTSDAGRQLALEFGEFLARGGVDEELTRHRGV